LHVVEELGGVDGLRLEGDLLAVAEAEIDGRLVAGRLRLARLEAAPVADDLLAPLRTVIIVAGAIFLDGRGPGGGRLDVLAPVLELAGEGVARLGAEGRLAAA